MRSIKLTNFRLRRIHVPVYKPVHGLGRQMLQNLGIWTGDVAHDIVGYRPVMYLKYVG